jgi:hypothetical protein
VFVTLACFTVIGAGAAVAAVVAAGTVAVHVDDGGPDGGNVHVVVPAALIEAAVGLAPDHLFEEVATELDRAGVLRDGGRSLHAVADALADLPDCVLVEVRDRSTHVRVESRGGKLRVRIDEPDTRVRIDVPIRSVHRVLERIAEA